MIPSSAMIQKSLARRYEAGAYTPRSAAAALSVVTAQDGSRWAINPLTGNDWQRLHVMVSTSPGNNLWGISGIYYDAGPSYALETEIYNVPQNKKLQGSDMNTGLYPGDEILIPGLMPPADILGAGAGEGTPDTPGSTSPIPTTLPTSWPTTAPEGWPAGVPWPGATAEAPPADPTQYLPPPPTGMPDLGAALPGVTVPDGTIPVSVQAPQASSTTLTTTTGDQKFWTTPKIAVAAGVGVVAVGTILYLVMRKPRRRR